MDGLSVEGGKVGRIERAAASNGDEEYRQH